MIKKYGSIINVLLILILSAITFKAVQIKAEKDKLNELYTGETAMKISETGLNYAQFNQVITTFDNIDGITASSSYVADNIYINNTLFIDQIYFEKYLNKFNVTGDNFTPDDFKIEFTKDTVIPILINANYAKRNNLKIGDETTILNYLPSVCELYSDNADFTGDDDGTAVKNNEINNQVECTIDNTFDYLMDDNGFAQIPVKVIGTFDNQGRSFPGFPIELFPRTDFIAPRFIVKNSNEQLYDLQKYRNGEPTITKDKIVLFINLDTISDTELNQQIKAIEQELGTRLEIEKVTDWQKFEIEDKISMYNQGLVNYIFISVIIVVVWLLQLYYRLLAFQYESAVLTLLGVHRNQILKLQFKKQIPISIVILVIVVIIGMLLNILWYVLIYDLLLIIMEQVIFKLDIRKVTQENINQLLTGGNL